MSKTFYWCASISAVIQVILLIVFFQWPQTSDQVVHMAYAEGAFSEGSWYPTAGNLHDNFIVAPGLINFLILQLRLLGTMDFNGIFQFIMNMIMMFEVCYIGKKLFSDRVGYIAGILYCLLYSNYLGILIWGTEIPFLSLALSGICLCLTDKWYNIAAAAVLFSLSNTIRPLVFLFVALAVMLFLIRKVDWRKYVLLLLPFLLLNWGYGKLNETRTGYFINQSTTGGVNLIQTAHDRADGTTARGSVIVHDPESPYAYENNREKDVFEKDRMWKDAGIEWIKKNPWKYFKMFFKKVPYMWGDDAWPERLLFDSGFSKTMASTDSSSGRVMLILGVFLKNIIYYLICLCFLFSLYVNRKQILSAKGVLLLFLLMGTGATVLFPVMPRYHYPLLFVVVLWAAYGVDLLIDKKKTELHDEYSKISNRSSMLQRRGSTSGDHKTPD